MLYMLLTTKQNKVTALTKLELAIAVAPGFGNFPARHIKPDEMSSEVRGEGKQHEIYL